MKKRYIDFFVRGFLRVIYKTHTHLLPRLSIVEHHWTRVYFTTVDIAIEFKRLVGDQNMFLIFPNLKRIARKLKHCFPVSVRRYAIVLLVQLENE